MDDLGSALGGGRGVAIVSLVFSACILLLILFSFRWRRCRWPAPMPWDVYRTIALGQLRLVHAERHPLDGETLEVTELNLADFDNLTSGEANVPLRELLEFAVRHPFMGYKGGVARLVAKLSWLPRGSPTLEAEIEGFNDVDLIYFLRDGEEGKKIAVKATVDAGLSIGGIPVEAQDVEYTFDTLPTVIATRDLTINQCIIVSDDQGKVFLINAKVCREHCLSGTVAPNLAPENATLDENGRVICANRCLSRAVIALLRGRATTVEFDAATWNHYKSTKITKTAQFQVFSKAKNNEQYMKAYALLSQWGFLERTQFPHSLWGECYAHVNATLARHGYRLEPDSEWDSAAVEIWKEAKYAEQHARSRVNIFRDFRWHQMVLDTSFTMEYKMPDSHATLGLQAHITRESSSKHISRDHLNHHKRAAGRAVRVDSSGNIRNSDGEKATEVAGSTWSFAIARDSDGQRRVDLNQLVTECSALRTKDIIDRIRTRGSVAVEEEAALHDDPNEPLLKQTLFGKMTIANTLAHVIRLTRPAWVSFGTALLFSCIAAVFYIGVINQQIGIYFLLVAAVFSIAASIQFNRALNKALYHALRSMFLALLNMRLEAFTARLFPEFWARLTGDSRVLAVVIKCLNDVFVELLTIAGATIAVVSQVPNGCFTTGISDALWIVCSCVVLMFVTSIVAGFALRLRSHMVRSLVGFTYFQTYSALTRVFEMKAIPEEASAATAAYSETQQASLEERMKMAVIEDAVSLFLQYVELACLSLVLPLFVEEGLRSDPTGDCASSFAVNSIALSLGLSSVRRLCVNFVTAMQGVGSLERFFLLGQTALRAVATRFDGIAALDGEVTLEVPSAFTIAVGGSPEFGPFAHVPALPRASVGHVNAMFMPRGSGATTFAKVLLRMHPALAKVQLCGKHIEQYEAMMLTWAIHIIDHAPFPSNIAKHPGQGKTLADFVLLGIGGDAHNPLEECLERSGIRDKVMNIPSGVESTTWASVMTEAERCQVQLAQALYRATLGSMKVLVAVDPLRGCPAEDVDRLRDIWLRALVPLSKKVLVVVIEQTWDPAAWRLRVSEDEISL